MSRAARSRASNADQKHEKQIGGRVKGLRYNPLAMLDMVRENQMLGARRAQGSVNLRTQNDNNDNERSSFSAIGRLRDGEAGYLGASACK